MKKIYYHVSSIANHESILAEGLKSDDDGLIFLFDTLTYFDPTTYTAEFVSDHIAEFQVGSKDYYVYEIHPKGITGEMRNDNVGEIIAKFQWKLSQRQIEPRFIRFYFRRRSFIAESRHHFKDITNFQPPFTG